MQIRPFVSFLKIIIYFFLAVVGASCGERGLLSGCSAGASHCCGFSCFWTWAVGPLGFSNCGTWSQWLRLAGFRPQA